MYSKKQRIISFLTAFLLIFTFAFINPLTISRSYAALPVAIAIPVQRIITSVVTSSGIITRLAQLGTNTAAIDTAIKNFVTMIFLTLTLSERQELLNLEISEDNKVEVPTELYNSIKTSAEQLTLPDTYSLTLSEQGISTKYSSIISNSQDYSDLNFPIYEGSFVNGSYTYKKYDMTEAEPFFVYEGQEGATTLNKNNITTNIFNFKNSSSEIPDYPPSSNGIDYIYCVPDGISMYQIPTYNNTHAQQMILYYYISGTKGTLNLHFVNASNEIGNTIINGSGDNLKNYSILNNIMKVYFIKKTGSSKSGILYEIIDYNGNVLYQNVSNERLTSSNLTTGYGINTLINQNYSDTITTDLTFEQELNPTPVVSNTENTANILTVPSELQGILESTSATINVTETINPDVPDNPTNTETLDNINTNVGELVTGGELGSEVNTNIEDVEGLHSEITDQVDFGSIFRTISQYISALDISSVTWFPTAVAGFIAPFIPLISLGLILFFIDRILNGGA